MSEDANSLVRFVSHRRSSAVLRRHTVIIRGRKNERQNNDDCENEQHNGLSHKLLLHWRKETVSPAYRSDKYGKLNGLNLTRKS